MSNKLNYEGVKAFIEVDSGSGCKLVSKTYSNMSGILTIQCSCGALYERSFERFKFRKAKKCDLCNTRYKENRYMLHSKKRSLGIDHVRDFIKSVSGNALISKEYSNQSGIIEIECHCGNIYQTSFKSFKKQKVYTCRDCTNKRLSEAFLKPQVVFAEGVSKASNGEVVVIGKYRGMSSKVRVKHTNSSCGFEWYANPSDILHKKSSCPSCAESRGEKRVKAWLEAHDFEFKTQFKINGCVNKRRLPFDFAVTLPDKSLHLIEYDGIVHYDNRCFGGKSFENTQRNDLIKTTFCERNSIPLTRIPYTKFDEIETILENTLR